MNTHVPEQPVTFTVIWRFLLGTCELIHKFCVTEENPVIMLQIGRAALQSFVARAVRLQGFYHPWSVSEHGITSTVFSAC